MTTANSSVDVLRVQALSIARKVKRLPPNDKDGLKFAVAMDDKTFVVYLSWSAIKDTTEAALAEHILQLMLGARSH